MLFFYLVYCYCLDRLLLILNVRGWVEPVRSGEKMIVREGMPKESVVETAIDSAAYQVNIDTTRPSLITFFFLTLYLFI